MDWLDLLAVHGTPKSLLQHHSSKASVLWCSAFFIVQLSHPYMTTGKTIALTRWTFVGKVMSLLFNRLSRLVIAFLPKSKCLLISWLQSLWASDFGAPQNKVSISVVSPSICHEVMGPDAMILVFWMLSFKANFSLSSFTLVKRLFSSSCKVSAEKESQPGSQARKGKFIRGKREGDWLLRRNSILTFWWSLYYIPPMKNPLKGWLIFSP